MTGLTKDQRVIVSLPKGKKTRGVITCVFEKSYRVRLDEGGIDRFSAQKVKPESTRKPTAKLEPLAAVRDIPAEEKQANKQLGELLRLHPIPKPERPELCPAWLAFVRAQPCCNCGLKPGQAPIEAHHEGKKGLGQKVRDTMAVPLCWVCHYVYTLKNALPIPNQKGPALRSREETLEILRNAQEHLLTEVLAQLDQQDRIELLSKGLAKVRDLAPLLGRITEAA